MDKLKIDTEFKSLIPPLTAEEFTQLEQNIINDGCRDALTVWNGTITDGHNRYEICTRNKIPFSTKEMDFQNRDEAIEWIIRNQFGRRNINPFARAELALRLKDVVMARAMENKVSAMAVARKHNPNNASEQFNPNWDKSEKPVNTLAELGKVAGVGKNTVWKTDVIKNEGSEEVQARARSGEISVSKAFNLTRQPALGTRVCAVCGKEKDVVEFHRGLTECKQCRNTRRRAGLSAGQSRELNKLFPSEEIDKIYEEMKKPPLPEEESGIGKANRNSIISEFEELLKDFNRKIKKFTYMPQANINGNIKTLANETIGILKTIIE